MIVRWCLASERFSGSDGRFTARQCFEYLAYHRSPSSTDEEIRKLEHGDRLSRATVGIVEERVNEGQIQVDTPW